MMRRNWLFYGAAAALALFETANVYFIMPFPGSQRLDSLDLAYALHSWRWPVRALLGAALIGTAPSVWRGGLGSRFIGGTLALLAAGVTYMTNFVMSADRMFRVPSSLVMAPASASVVDSNRLVVGIVAGGEARAYPIQFIGYHHQVPDTVGGVPVLVTYCTVCRTGRAFSPVVDGKTESFRLVGMDHFNAMLEDRTTGSWWRQANGEAIAGAHEGRTLEEIPSRQVTLRRWLALHPASLVMQPDPAFTAKYPSSFDFESGASRSRLTGTDTASWGEKSWVVGITLEGVSRAYDWNRLKRDRILLDTLGGRALALVLARDDASFFAFERPAATTRVAFAGDSLDIDGAPFALDGSAAHATLRPLSASQEFWHSWRSFQPATTRY